jgi:hypothetical protein
MSELQAVEELPVAKTENKPTQRSRPVSRHSYRRNAVEEVLAPDYRKMAIFSAAAILVVTALLGFFLWVSNSLAGFVETHSKAVWAENFMKTSGRIDTAEGTLVNHGLRLDKLEQANQDTRQSLTRMETTLTSMAQDIKDVKEARRK